MFLEPPCLLLLMTLLVHAGNTVSQDGGLSAWFGFVVLFWKWTFISYKGVHAVTTTKLANIGTTQILDCYIKDDSPDITKVIEWKKYGIDASESTTVFMQYQPFPPNIHNDYKGRVKLVNGASLEISHIRASDEGLYECSIEYINGIDDKSNNTWVHLKVNAPPKITSMSPSSLPVLQGANIQLFCRGTGTPKPDIVWSKDGEPLVNTDRITVALDKETVDIKQVQRSDGGSYLCTFTNAVGATSQRIDLIVEGAAYILNPPTNMTVLKGQKITFTCRAEAYPNNITYRWYFKDRNVNTLDGYGARILTQPNGALVITSVYEFDMGWYYCRPSNGVGEDPEAGAFLNVTYAPVVIDSLMPGRVTWALGFQKRLDCPVDANPPIKEVSWTKDSYVVDFSSNRLTQLANGSLLIYEVLQVDSGSYSCTPISSLGSGRASPLVQVVVQDPPRFSIRPEPQYLRKPGENVTMPCEATGKPTPSVLWRKVTGETNFGGRSRLVGTNLTIMQLQKSDHGDYECEAENEVATIVTVTKLIIQMTTPHAPYNVTAIPDWFSARVSWIPADNGGSPQFFMIWYRSINGQTSKWLTMQVVPPNATTYTVYRLQPDTMYEFKILSRNDFGDGNFSEVIQVKTLGEGSVLPTALPTDPSGSTYIPSIERPIGPRPPPPRDVTSRIENGGIMITWKPPGNTAITITYYVIEMMKAGNYWQPIKDTILVPATSYLYTTAEPSTTYSFRVYVYTIVSYSIPSNITIITTPNDMEPVGFFLSQAQIGGIVGGLLFLLIAILLAVIGLICSKRNKDRHRSDKYGNVKYIGPADEADSVPAYRSENSAEWNSWCPLTGAGSLNRIDIRNGIFVIPQTSEVHRDIDMTQQEYLPESGLYDPEQYIYNSDRGHRVPFAGHHGSSAILRDDHSPSRIKGSLPSRERDHSLSSRWESFPHSYTSEQYPRSRSTSRWTPSVDNIPVNQSDLQRVPDSINTLPISSTTKYNLYGDDDDDENGFVPKRPPLPRGFEKANNVQDVSEPYYENFPPHLDDVFVPSNQNYPSKEKPGFPRHSSMKPSYKTYLTGDPINESDFAQPFSANDISSVLPSFTESSPNQSKDIFSYTPLDDSTLTNRLEKPNWNIPSFLFQGEGDQITPSYSRTHLHSSDSRPRSRSSGSRPRSRSSDARPHYSFDSSEPSLDETVRERHLSPVSPNRHPPTRGRTLNSERPYNYTREHLQGAIDKIRRGPRARKAKSLSRSSASELDSFDSTYPPAVPRGYREPFMSDSEIRRGSRDLNRHGRHQRYSDDIEPYKYVHGSHSSVYSSGHGSIPGRYRHLSEPQPLPTDTATPDSVSSGIGSRNTSQATGSSNHSRIPKHPESTSSGLYLPDHDISQDSSPFLDGSNSLRRDTSADENYEFDSLHALEEDLMHTLQNFSSISSPCDDELFKAIENGLSTSDFYDDLYPKPSRQSRYDDSEARFERLRQEYHQFQRKQQESFNQIRLAMDSEML